MTLGEPYVYSYYSHNYTQLLEVTRRALATPIERYIPKEMEFNYGLEKMRAYLDRDLVGMYEAVVAANNGSVPRLIAGAREQCYKLERCREPLPPGRRPASPPA